MATTTTQQAVVEATATPLSKEEYEQWVLDAHRLDAEIKAGLAEVKGGLWRAAKALYEFSEATGWTALGYDTLGDWLADPEITMTRSTFYRMVSTWQELHVLRKVPETDLQTVDMTKAAITLPALRRGEASVEEVLSDADVLGARDLRAKYTGGAGPGRPQHPTAPTGDGEELETAPDDWHPPALVDEETDELVPLVTSTTVARAVADTLTRVLEAVHKELGDPAAKRMSKYLRQQVEQVLMLAHDEGLGGHDG